MEGKGKKPSVMLSIVFLYSTKHQQGNSKTRTWPSHGLLLGLIFLALHWGSEVVSFQALPPRKIRAGSESLSLLASWLHQLNANHDWFGGVMGV